MRNRAGSFLRDRTVRSNWIKRNLTIFAIVFPVYLLNRIIKTYIEIPILGYLCNCHLNDYIGGIVFCIYLNMLLVFCRRKPVTLLSHLCIIMICVSLLWEYLFPLILPYSTSDILDVAAYMLGTFTYYMCIRKVPAMQENS